MRPGATLHTGALLALERGSTRMIALVAEAAAAGASLAVLAGVVAWSWREGARQVRLARLLSSPLAEVVPLDHAVARAAGALCGRTGAPDVVDASVVVCAAQRRHRIVTTDPADLRRIDPDVALERP